MRQLLRLPALLVAFGGTAVAVPAMAQMMNPDQPPSHATPTRHANEGPDNGANGAQPSGPPPAIPGAVSSGDSVVPADKTLADMQPNDALFDAIQRGDEAAARDALNRGADLHATNVLGQTPLDLSIDLNRNAITFLLLSMRGSDSNGAPPRALAAALPPGGPAAAAGPASPTTPATRTGGRPRRHRHGTALAASTPAGAGSRETSIPGAPRLFAGNGGTPNPSVGFIGFDSH